MYVQNSCFCFGDVRLFAILKIRCLHHVFCTNVFFYRSSTHCATCLRLMRRKIPRRYISCKAVTKFVLPNRALGKQNNHYNSKFIDTLELDLIWSSCGALFAQNSFTKTSFVKPQTLARMYPSTIPRWQSTRRKTATILVVAFFLSCIDALNILSSSLSVGKAQQSSVAKCLPQRSSYSDDIIAAFNCTDASESFPIAKTKIRIEENTGDQAREQHSDDTTTIASIDDRENDE